MEKEKEGNIREGTFITCLNFYISNQFTQCRPILVAGNLLLGGGWRSSLHCLAYCQSGLTTLYNVSRIFLQYFNNISTNFAQYWHYIARAVAKLPSTKCTFLHSLLCYKRRLTRTRAQQLCPRARVWYNLCNKYSLAPPPLPPSPQLSHIHPLFLLSLSSVFPRSLHITHSHKSFKSNQAQYPC